MSSNPIMDKIEQFGDRVIEMRKAHEAETAALRDRIEVLEALGDRPRGSSHETPESRDHKQFFADWLRAPADGNTKRRLDEIQHRLVEKGEIKAVLIGSNAAGGYALPKEIETAIEKKVNALNPFRSLVRVLPCSTRDYHHLVSKGNGGSGWVGETDSRSETTSPELVDCAPTFGTLYAYPKASEESMQDIAFDVQGWLVDEVADAFAEQEAIAIVSGNGSAKPSGFLNTAPTNADDNASPQRVATALQYIGVNASPLRINADALIDLSMSVKDGYLIDQASVAWVMRRATAATVMKLKDPSTGAYIWQQSLQAGVPPLLLGYPVRLTDAMPANSAGNHPIAFGNWRRGYLLADRIGTMQITIDNNITTPGYVKFYVRRVVGGKVLNNDAVKVLKIA